MALNAQQAERTTNDRSGRANALFDDPAAAARLEAIGAQHGFALDATRAMAQAVLQGGGGMAQFHHPALGGSGQWMRGGMVMIGDLFNRALADRVGALGNDVAAWLSANPVASAPQTQVSPESHAAGATREPNSWWPAGLQSPSTSGAQNGLRYAYFADAHRLAIERDGAVQLYDTGEHRIGGVSQQQGSGRSDALQFSSQHGPVDLASLRRLDSVTAAAPQSLSNPAPHSSPSPPSEGSRDALDLLAKLADLHRLGVLSDDEFTTKKSELLRRI